MNEKLPEELTKARNLFKEFENATTHKMRLRSFRNAIEALSDYEDEFPTSQHDAFIKNIKHAYTRSLLRVLSDVTTVEPDDWFEYLLVITKVKKEADNLRASEPDIETGYNRFIGIWKKAAIEAIKSM